VLTVELTVNNLTQCAVCWVILIPHTLSAPGLLLHVNVNIFAFENSL